MMTTQQIDAEFDAARDLIADVRAQLDAVRADLTCRCESHTHINRRGRAICYHKICIPMAFGKGCAHLDKNGCCTFCHNKLAALDMFDRYPALTPGPFMVEWCEREGLVLPVSGGKTKGAPSKQASAAKEDFPGLSSIAGAKPVKPKPVKGPKEAVRCEDVEAQVQASPKAREETMAPPLPFALPLPTDPNGTVTLRADQAAVLLSFAAKAFADMYAQMMQQKQ